MENFILNLIFDGLSITASTFVLTLFLDFLSVNYIYKLFKEVDGKKLYIESFLMNLFNNIVLGTLAFIVFSYFFEVEKKLTFTLILVEFFLLLIIQAFGYYFAHRIMHTPTFYFIHRFHHKYSKIVIPMAANSVSILEYIFAYLSPFIIGIILIRPSRFSLKLAISCVSLGNLLIHTPWLSDLSDKYIPDYFVKTSDHLDHHRVSSRKFSAPILNLDNINF